MKTSIAALSLALLIGLVTADIAAADQRSRREEFREPQTDEVEQEAVAIANGDAAAAPPSTLGLIIYPAGGQDSVQQAADESECAGAQDQAGETADVGVDEATPVTDDYAERHNDFTDKIKKVTEALR